MSRLKPKTDVNDVEKLVGKVDMFHTRLGEYRYILVFRRPVYANGRRIVLVYNGNRVNNKLVGFFTGMTEKEVTGKHLALKDAPDELINDAIRWLP